MCSLQTETKLLILINLKLRMKPEHIRNACQTKMADVKIRPKSLCDSRDELMNSGAGCLTGSPWVLIRVQIQH